MTLDVVQEATKNFKSTIGRQYSVADAQKVWDGVALWIEKYICKHKGVIVPGLGTFTLSEWALETGLGKPLIVCRPAFLLAEGLVQAFSLHQRQVFPVQGLACHMIHYGGVASFAGLNRNMVKTCIQEVTQALKRLLWESEDVSLSLGAVGRLLIRDKQVCLDFRPELLDKIRGLTERRRVTVKPVYPWSPKRILE